MSDEPYEFPLSETPWVVRNDSSSGDILIVTPGQRVIARLPGAQVKDGQMIVAAPDLFALVVSMFEEEHDPPELLARAKATLKRVRGGSG